MFGPRRKRSVLVSVHDVSPAHEERVRLIMSFLSNLGVSQGALLIIPNYRRRWLCTDHPAWCQFITGCSKQGWELVLHGYSHLDEGPRNTLGWLDRFKAQHLTAGEGEFLTIGEVEAAARIERGRAILKQAFALSPIGFVPPAWLCSAPALKALKESGLRFSENHLFIQDLQYNRKIFSPAVTWASRTPMRKQLSIVWARVTTPLYRPLNTLRVALHPGDFEHPSLVESIRQMLSQLMSSGFQPRTYTGLLGRAEEVE